MLVHVPLEYRYSRRDSKRILDTFEKTFTLFVIICNCGIFGIFLFFGVLTITNKWNESRSIAGLASWNHVIQIQSDNGEGSIGPSSFWLTASIAHPRPYHHPHQLTLPIWLVTSNPKEISHLIISHTIWPSPFGLAKSKANLIPDYQPHQLALPLRISHKQR